MKYRSLIIFIGILMPLWAVAFGTWASGAIFSVAKSDLLHTFGHILLLLIVPTVNWCMLKSLERDKDGVSLELSFYNGFAVSVSLIYCLILLPLVSQICILIFEFISALIVVPIVIAGLVSSSLTHASIPPDIGLCWNAGLDLLSGMCSTLSLIVLALSPLCALTVSQCLASQNQISTAKQRGKGNAYLFGFLIGFAVVLCYDCQAVVFQAALTSLGTNPEKERAAIRLLRGLGCDKELLSLCYKKSDPLLDIDTLLFRLNQQPIPSSTARQLYYRVTGENFNKAEMPKLAKTRNWFELAQDVDSDLASDEVGGRAAGVSLTKSAISGTANADYGAADLSWNIEFTNSSADQKEARAEILLPPGAVVSDAILWMNGQPKTATFMETWHATQIYRNIVLNVRRDPLLLRTCGRDRVFMQCFPVEPHSTMRLRLSISVPLQFCDTERAVLAMPHFVENNFEVATLHCVDVSLREGQYEHGFHTKLSNGSLADTAVELSKKISGNELRTVNVGGCLVQQSLERIKVPSFQRVEFVIDGSLSMREHLRDVLSVLKSVPNNCHADVFLASDEIGGSALDSVHPLSLTDAQKELREIQFVGGPDNVPALLAATRYAKLSNRGAVVWLHGPQPILFDASRNDLSLLLAEPHSDVSLLDVPLTDGPDRVAEKLETTFTPNKPILISCDRTKDLGTRLQQELFGNEGKYVINRYQSYNSIALDDDRLAALAVAKLWRYSEATSYISQRDLLGAINVGLKNRLVTPVTAAIVYDPSERYVTKSWSWSLEEQPGPGLDGVLKHAPGMIGEMCYCLPHGEALSMAINKAFEAVVSQLNNTSAAAGSGDLGAYSKAAQGNYGTSGNPVSQTATVFNQTKSLTEPAVRRSPEDAGAEGKSVFPTITSEPMPTVAAKKMNLADRTDAERSLQAWISGLGWIILSLLSIPITIALLRHRVLYALLPKRRLAIQTAVGFSMVVLTVLTGLYLIPTLRDAICLWF